MLTADLIHQAAREGVQMTLTDGGRLRLLGTPDDVACGLPICWPYRADLVAELQTAKGCAGLLHRAGGGGTAEACPLPR